MSESEAFFPPRDHVSKEDSGTKTRKARNLRCRSLGRFSIQGVVEFDRNNPVFGVLPVPLFCPTTENKVPKSSKCSEETALHSRGPMTGQLRCQIVQNREKYPESLVAMVMGMTS